MKRILKHLTITFIAVVVASFSAFAQDRVSIVQNKYAHKNDSVYVDFRIELNNADVSPRAFVLLTPVIQTETKSQELPTVMINGKNRHKTYLRMVSMGHGPAGVEKVINAAAQDAHQPVLYSVAVPYQDWMEEADFAIREDQCDCNGPLVKMSFNLITGRMQDLTPTVNLAELNFVSSYVKPQPEPVKHRSETGKAYLDFAIGKYSLDPAFNRNAAELAKIGDMVQNAKSNPAVTITRISIDGWSSPDGAFTTNMMLSGKRAAALMDYVKSAYVLDEHLLNVSGRGEDWAAFERLIEESELPYREQALEIIRSAAEHDAKERKLRTMQDGAPWKDMITGIFPKLRRSDYELQYTVIPFTVEQGKEKLETAPSLLSLNEMFLIAQTYPVGSEDFQRVFDIAVKTFPNDPVANVNAAATALEKRDAEAAAGFMERMYPLNAAGENNLGIIAAMRGDYEKADAHFAKAAEGGNAEAVQNIGEMEKIKMQIQKNKKAKGFLSQM